MRMMEVVREEAAAEVDVVGGELVSAVPTRSSSWSAASPYERVARMASGNAVVVFSVSGCCMCHVVKRLLLGLGVGPAIYELDQEKGGREIQAVLAHLLADSTSSPSSSSMSAAAAASVVPAVFVGGKLLGGVEKVMSCHINGSLVPLLKQAGALWL